MKTYQVQFDVHGWVEYKVLANNMQEAIDEAKDHVKQNGYFQRDLEVQDLHDRVTGISESEVAECSLIND